MPQLDKETKAQRAERLKLAKNPWERLDEIRRFAREGFGSIPPEWLGTYFRWWGVYTQGDGGGVTGGKREGNAAPYFMVRIRIPNGLLFSHQLRAIADLSERCARGSADVTVRHNIQLHWVTIETLPEVFETLWRCGLTTLAACGDVTRNITGCPVAGLDAGEMFDASRLALDATRMLVGNPDFYNLPRKYKICVTGCRSWCCYPEINDVGLTAIRKDRELGYSLRVGGGLSTEPHLAVRLNAFVRQNQALAVIRAVTEIFRDSDCLRESRERARMKYLFLRHNWTPDSFLEELNRRLGCALEPAGREEPPADVYRDHIGVHEQKQAGYCYVGASVVRGRLTPEQMRAAAGLADRYAAGELRTTNMQNLVIVNVPVENADAVASGLEAAGLPPGGSVFARGAVACTGTEYCKLALTETKSFTRWLVEQLDERLPEFDQHLRLNVTGCPNSCGQHWIADIGIEGKKIKENGRLVDAFAFAVGGAVGRHQALARPVGYRCAAGEVPEAIERLLRAYLDQRAAGENLRSFFNRHGETELRAFLAGAPESQPCSPDKIQV
jgi:sulfite reductase (ferredoxin)